MRKLVLGQERLVDGGKKFKPVKTKSLLSGDSSSNFLFAADQETQEV